MADGILVTGGSGFIGARLIERLVRDGRRVRALVRSPDAAGRVEALGARAVRGDLAVDGAAPLAAAMAGCAAVVHAAALFSFWAPSRDFRQINVEGTTTLLAAAREAGVPRLVGIGAAAVVMDRPAPLQGATEHWPTFQPAFAPYAASKAEAERRILAANGDGLTTLVLRPPMVWGPAMPALDHMTTVAASGRFRWPDSGRQRMMTCHVDNLVHAIGLALERGRGGEAYFVADAGEAELRPFVTALLATRGVPAPTASAPFGVAWAMAGAFETAWRVLPLRGEPPLTRQMLRLIGQDFTFSTAKVQAELGYRPVLSREEGLAAMAGPQPALRRAA